MFAGRLLEENGQQADRRDPGRRLKTAGAGLTAWNFFLGLYWVSSPYGRVTDSYFTLRDNSFLVLIRVGGLGLIGPERV